MKPRAADRLLVLAAAALLGLTVKAVHVSTSGAARHVPPVAFPPPTPIPELEMGFRAREVADEPWPDDVRLDVIYGRVRSGFTVAQMRMAMSTGENRLGEPDRRVQDVVGPQGRGEAWIYAERAFVVAGDRVVEIRDARRLAVQ